jgi:hypothetical protein
MSKLTRKMSGDRATDAVIVQQIRIPARKSGGPFVGFRQSVAGRRPDRSRRVAMAATSRDEQY